MGASGAAPPRDRTYSKQSGGFDSGCPSPQGFAPSFQTSNLTILLNYLSLFCRAQKSRIAIWTDFRPPVGEGHGCPESKKGQALER